MTLFHQRSRAIEYTGCGMSWRRAVAFILICFPATAQAQGPLWSVAEFMERKADWDGLIGAPVRVEGRVLTQAGPLLKLQQCPLAFELSETAQAGARGHQTVELFGRFAKSDSKLVFKVERAEKRPSDTEWLRDRENKFKSPVPDDYFKLAKWAFDRSAFYQKDEGKEKRLEKAGMELVKKGVRLEYTLLSPVDPAGLRRVADLALEWMLSEDFAAEFQFEALLLESSGFTSKLPDSAAAADRWIVQQRQSLPGAGVPLTKKTLGHLDSFRKEALTAYRAARDSQTDATDHTARLSLHRAMVLETDRRRMEALMNADGANAGELAAVCRERWPELVDVARRFDDRFDSYRIERAPQLSRGELQSLAEEFEQRRKAQAANQVKMAWLQARERQLRLDGPQGMVQLARDVLAITHDKARAVELLQRAYRQNPKLDDIREEFTRLGYRLAPGGSWVHGDEMTPAPVAVDAPAAASELKPGIAAADVRRILGQPTSIARMTTGRSVSELWTFGTEDTGRVVLQMERKGIAEGLQLVRVHDVK